MCDQQSLRSACAYAQSDRSLCYSLEYFMSVKQMTEHHLEFLSFKGGCTGSSESTLVKIPHCWKSHVAAHLLINAREFGKLSRQRASNAQADTRQGLRSRHARRSRLRLKLRPQASLDTSASVFIIGICAYAIRC